MEQLHLAHDLRNTLVEIHQRHSVIVADVWRTRPEIAAHELAVRDAQAAAHAAADAVKTWKIEHDGATAPTELTGAARDARAATKAARLAHKLAKRNAYEALAPRFHQLTNDRHREEKALYGPFRKRGLFWATFNDVRRHHDRAIQAMRATRLEGRSADVRTRDWTGEGTLVVELQKDARDRVRGRMRDPAILSTPGTTWSNVVRLPPIPDRWETLTRSERRRVAGGEVRIRLGADPDANDKTRWLTIPVIFHRRLPPDGEVVTVQVIRRRVGSRFKVTVNFVVTTPDPAPRSGTSRIGIDLGWRPQADGSVRVASWAANRPLPYLHPEVESWVHTTSGRTTGYVAIPAGEFAHREYLAAIRSRRDVALNRLRAAVIDAIDADQHLAAQLGPGEQPLLRTDVERWRRDHFVGLGVRLEALEVDDPLKERIVAWMRRDRRLGDHYANDNAQHIAHRNNTYRALAAAIATGFDQVSMSDLAAGGSATADDVTARDSDIRRSAGAIRAFVAPSRLAAAVRSAAMLHGCQLDNGSLLGETRRCAGTEPPPLGDYADRIESCDIANTMELAEDAKAFRLSDRPKQ